MYILKQTILLPLIQYPNPILPDTLNLAYLRLTQESRGRKMEGIVSLYLGGFVPREGNTKVEVGVS